MRLMQCKVGWLPVNVLHDMLSQEATCKTCSAGVLPVPCRWSVKEWSTTGVVEWRATSPCTPSRSACWRPAQHMVRAMSATVELADDVMCMRLRRWAQTRCLAR